MFFVALLILITLSAFFSSLETGLLALGEIKIREWSKEKMKSLKIWNDEPAAVITGILIGNNLVNITLNDTGGLIDYQHVWVNITSINDLPEINMTIPDQLKPEDNPIWGLDLENYCNDTEDIQDLLVWSVSGVNASLVDVDLLGHIITFTPLDNASGSNLINITLTDTEGGFDFQFVWVKKLMGCRRQDKLCLQCGY